MPELRLVEKLHPFDISTLLESLTVEEIVTSAKLSQPGTFDILGHLYVADKSLPYKSVP